ncbi:O-succinylhomoserine sulfhydrylase [Azospirillum sp. A1-3]|jgi:O-succinylhomoserine sulfhydrylase|uniref:O-succinylhomoserine sulfhydrylase n=1 Tax=unclassified Azospirillum TaxID=2630922 RepID=UPI000D61BF7C|nr:MULTISPECIES: O-succinylhomoserine sulfhydrylase [unclassified Azospirillum]MCM8733791.1 O-succinylhomoserine sulfhydrylase [Azospirillum sp. A1-3]PWC94416.1 O-succinylhomoserine sulfhydrylase [Azospirillum sp. TSO5]
MSRTDHRNPNVAGLRPRSKLVHGGIRRSQFDETCEALYQTSGFVYGSAEEAENAFANDGTRHVYSRFRNPTSAMFEDRLAEYEGAEWAYATASGMAAVHGALMSGLRAGDRVVAPRALFISCYWILKELCGRYGIETVFVDGTNLTEWEEALSKPTKAVFLETPSNPGLEVVDLRAVCDLAHKAGAVVVVDNAFATPVLQRPFDFGADVIIYSATKHIDGQGRCLGGVILAKDKKYASEVIHPFLRNTGPTISPFNSWLLLKGMETLELRVQAQSAAGLQVAEFLESHPKVAQVLYPLLPSHPQYDLVRKQMTGGGNMLSVFLKGGKTEAFNTLNGLRMVMISNNLGDSKSLITHPATTTHSKLTDEEKVAARIEPGLLRLSVGLEDPQDIIEDLDRALAEA